MRITPLLAIVVLSCSAYAGALPRSADVQTTITDRVSGFTSDEVKGRSEQAKLSWRQRERRRRGQRVLEMTIENHADALRCIAVEHRFRLEGLDHRPFTPTVEPHPEWPEDG